MEYREHRPCARALGSEVACYWTLRGRSLGAARHRVLPDGCIDLLFDLSDEPAARVIGVMTTGVVTPARAAGASVDLIGVRFRPGEAAAVLGVAARETRDRALALRDVCSWGQDLAARLRETGPDAGRFAILDAALLARGRRLAPDRRLRAAVSALTGAAGDVAAVAAHVGLAPRHLLRLFEERVGIGPKALARVARLQALVTSLDGLAPGRRPAWSQLAAAGGFADQAHLVREVRALAGTTPSMLLRERAHRLGMSETSNPPAAVAATVDA